MKAIPVSIVMLALAAGLAAPVSAQTATANGPDAQKKVPLGTLKVQSPRTAHKRNTATNQLGKQATPGKHLTVGYQENDITAAPFGSKHWWAVHGWQAGGSSPP